MVSEAIGHLTEAGEFDAASKLIDDHWLAFTNAGQRETVARWMERRPNQLRSRRDSIIRTMPAGTKKPTSTARPEDHASCWTPS